MNNLIELDAFLTNSKFLLQKINKKFLNERFITIKLHAEFISVINKNVFLY